jgi:hypothetical protein
MVELEEQCICISFYLILQRTVLELCEILKIGSGDSAVRRTWDLGVAFSVQMWGNQFNIVGIQVIGPQAA